MNLIVSVFCLSAFLSSIIVATKVDLVTRDVSESICHDTTFKRKTMNHNKTFPVCLALFALLSKYTQYLERYHCR